MAAMSRADISGEQRTPFYLYVDEFQNFATDSFATILSEARKYGLNLTVANQYTAQMMPEVKDAVFGNVGSIICFRTSADDARTMLKYFEPKFTDYDLVHMHNRHFAVSMTIEGEKVAAFSAISLNLPPFTTDYSPQIIAHSRAQYAQSKDFIERYVKGRYLTDDRPAPNQQSPKQPQPKPRPAAQPPAASKPELAQSSATPPATPAATLSQAALGGVAPVSAPVSTAAPTGVDEEAKPKRKRTRRRKRKTPEAGGTTGPTSQQVARAIEEGVIRLN
jgi:hypothetical protein